LNSRDYSLNHKNYNCDWFKKLLFPTNSPAKPSPDSLRSDSPTNQSHSKLHSKSTNNTQSCSSSQPITTLVSITIETVYKLLNWGFLQNGEFFPLEQFSNQQIHFDCSQFQCDIKQFMHPLSAFKPRLRLVDLNYNFNVIG